MDRLPAEALALLAAAPVEFAVVFGSAARGREGPRSDLDIGIGLSPGCTVTLRERLDLAVALDRILRREVDLVVLDEAKPLLRFEAARGKRVYERAPGAFGSFAARALLEWDDVRPHLLRCGRAMLRGLGEVR